MAVLAGSSPLSPLLGNGQARATDFGRWQTATSRCTWQRGASTLRQDCQAVRLEQNLHGLLSVRFLAGGHLDPPVQEHLVFAGALESEQTAMRCGDDGRCNPHWPARLAVATVADTRFDPRGLVMGLPRTHLARGHCQLERTQVHCQAEGRGGGTWIAEASLSTQPPVAGAPLR